MEPNGYLEHLTRFLTRIFCSRECHYAYKKALRPAVDAARAAGHQPLVPEFGRKYTAAIVTKPCAHCGAMMVKSVTVDRKVFDSIKCCSPKCAGALKVAQRAAACAHVPFKTCERCGERFKRRYNPPSCASLHGSWESPKAYLKRRFCSRECSDATPRGRAVPNEVPSDAADVVRSCLCCGAVLVRREVESPAQYLWRRHCGRECYDEWRKTPALGPCRPAGGLKRWSSATWSVGADA